MNWYNRTKYPFLTKEAEWQWRKLNRAFIASILAGGGILALINYLNIDPAQKQNLIDEFNVNPQATQQQIEQLQIPLTLCIYYVLKAKNKCQSK